MTEHYLIILSIILNVVLLVKMYFLYNDNKLSKKRNENIRISLYWLRKAAIQSANLLDKEVYYATNTKKYLADDDMVQEIIIISSMLNRVNKRALIKETIKKHG